MQNLVAIKELYFKEYMYRDINQSNDMKVASNIDDVRFSKDLNNFLTEAQVLSEFSSLDGVVKVLDYFCENNTAYIVMEYIDGISLLEQVIKNGPIFPVRKYCSLGA